MATRAAQAEWSGDVKHGHGTIALGSGAFSGSYSFGSRFESEPGTNPEELIAAAHAGCFSMALSLILGAGGHPPEKITTTAKVTIEPEGDGFTITSSALTTTAEVPGIDAAAFATAANAAKDGCPVSKALAGTRITLDARLA
ncbi:MAG TPA: OsmC family protein [Candidatus Baltobacteraceae bacterium]|nr:OsmC family protein [Candidatus Baltobacteraceae bacterium]